MSSCSSCTSSAQFSIKAYQQQQQKSQIDPSQQSQKDAGHTAHLDNDFAKGDAAVRAWKPVLPDIKDPNIQ